MNPIQQAFHTAIADAQKPSVFYVVLWRHFTTYGGPEEGGWHRHHCVAEAFKQFQSEEAANAAMAAVERLANQMTEEASKKHGEYCLRSVAEAEARGLEASDLPEVDGSDEYSVSVQKEHPENQIDNSHWE